MTRHNTLPIDLQPKWGFLRFVQQQGPNEYSAECPQCGDGGHAGGDYPDRFRIFIDGKARAWCRRCGYFEWADEGKNDFVVTPEMRQAWVDERIKRELDAKERIEQSLGLLRREQAWLRYHDNLTQTALDWWAGKGVPDYMVQALMLGWCEHRRFFTSADGEFFTDSATIPVYEPGWNIVNLRHRLVSPPSGNKYLPDRAGLPAAPYYTNPDSEPSGECILVEGEIKSIVVYDRLDNYKLTVVGTPGKSFKPEILDKVKAGCDRVWIVFDPDAKLQAWKAAQYIGKAARVVYLPCKPDDAFTMYGASVADFWAALRYGRQA